MTNAVLDIDDLWVEYRDGDRWRAAVRGASLRLAPGETLGLVGESGCGKSSLALALMGLLPAHQSRCRASRFQLDGQSLVSFDDRSFRPLRGRSAAMIFQDPFSALNPVFTVGRQVQEALELDGTTTPQAVLDLFQRVQLTDPNRMYNSYPHQISGGQRQRVMMAMAVARRPKLLIADEPTTALDVTIQDEIMRLLQQLQAEFQMALLFVTHNLGLVKQATARLAVMYAGQIVGEGPTEAVLSAPQHPYTAALLKSLPRLERQERLPVLPGQPPRLDERPAGCAFHPRCEKRFDPCDQHNPALRRANGNLVRCHLFPESA